ncbi:hypothetical protein diail_6134, partial [Diaporthe ilicicola]
MFCISVNICNGYIHEGIEPEDPPGTAKQAKQLKIEKSGKAQRNAAGQITQAAAYQSRSIPDARIEPNRKWFSNSRVISQDSLAAFRQAMSEKKADPYSVLLRTNKLPLSLVEKEKENGVEKHQAKMAIEASPFDTTFGPKSQRKRVKLDAGSFEDLARDVHQRLDSSTYPLDPDSNVWADDGHLSSAVEPIFKKGQSKRIWNELYRVIDSSDVLIQVLDARDPQGTRCESVEKYIRTEAPHKHLIFVVNKVDLVPTKIAASILGEEVVEGTTNTCAACQQFAVLHKDRKQISVGIIGYPNVGKSSIVNMLRGKKVAVVAPIPGATKVWQYVTLWKDTYLIDCPGIVPAAKQDTPEELLLRGVVRVENVEYPEQYIPTLLSRVKQHHLERTYNLQGGWTDHIHLLEQLARKGGRLLPGGEPD